MAWIGANDSRQTLLLEDCDTENLIPRDNAAAGDSTRVSWSKRHKRTPSALYEKWQAMKKPGPITEDDIKKYTGMSRSELMDWAASRGGGEKAGTVAGRSGAVPAAASTSAWTEWTAAERDNGRKKAKGKTS